MRRTFIIGNALALVRPVLLLAPALLALAARPPAEARTDAPPQRPLAPRAVENLIAFTRLLGYVRFFHPSDQAAGADWNRIAVAGVQAVEPAQDAQALARTLAQIFLPVAPTLRVFATGESPAPAPELAVPSGSPEPRVLMWRHYGVGLENPRWESRRIDDRTPFGYGTLAQSVAASPYRGRRVRLEAQVRAEVAAGGKAQLFLRVDRPGGVRGFFDNMSARPIVAPAWTAYAIEGEVAADAQSIVVGLAFSGGGRVLLDDVELRAVGGAPVANPLVNAGFESGEPGRQPPGWNIPYDSIRAGYRVGIARGGACRHGGCLELVADAAAIPIFPRPAETLAVDLGGGVSARVPLTVYADWQGSLPHRPAASPVGAADPASAPDRAARLAGVALLWPVLAHFHPCLADPAVAAGFARALPQALAEAAEDGGGGDDAYQLTLERMVAALPDGIAQVRPRGGYPTYQPPFLWEWIEGRLAIVWVAPGGQPLRAGDVVVEIGGAPTAQTLAEMETRTAAPTPEARRTRALARLAAGSRDERLNLTVARQGGPPLAVSLPRTVPVDTLVEERLAPIALVRPGIFYLDLRRLDDAKLEAALPRLASAQGLIFDLRGVTEASTVILSHLAQREAASSGWQKPVTTRPDHQGIEMVTTVWTIPARAPHLRARAAFLADGRTHGYAETLLLMVEHYRWAEIVGQPTAASNGDRNWLTLPGGYGVVWTGLRIRKPDGSPFQGVGVMPTVRVSPTLRGVAEGRDEVLEKALTVVDGGARG